MERHPRIGYACQNLDIAHYQMKTCRLSSITAERLTALIAENLQAMQEIIQYNQIHHITLFRISSSLIPFGSSEHNTLHWMTIFAQQFLALRKQFASDAVRISCHPGQYTILNSPNWEVVQRSLAELEYHADLLAAFGGNRTSKMILHIGGIYEGKEQAKKRFQEVYRNFVSERVKQHLVIEHDDRLYDIEDVLDISEKTGIPVVFDTLHHAVHGPTHKSPAEYMKQAMETWKDEDGIPKIHYSQQEPGKRSGSHSNTIDSRQFLEYYHTLPSHQLDIMLEVKDKNRSAVKVSQLLEPDQDILKQEWMRYRFDVLARSSMTASLIQSWFDAGKVIDAPAFYQHIETCMKQPPNQKQAALQEMWKIVADYASKKEQAAYLQLCQQENGIQRRTAFLNRLATKYEIKVVTDSYFFRSLDVADSTT